MRAMHREETQPERFAREFAAAREQAKLFARVGTIRKQPEPTREPIHLRCLDCGAQGHSTSLGNRILAWFFADALVKVNGAFEPVECFDRQVGCGKCGSHNLEGVNTWGSTRLV